MQCHNNMPTIESENAGVSRQKEAAKGILSVGKLGPFCDCFHLSRALYGSASDFKPVEISHNPLNTLYEVHGVKNHPNKITRSLRKMPSTLPDREQVFSA